MDLLIEKLDGSRYYLSQYKVLITDFEESAPSVTRNSTQLDQRNGSIDFGGWHTDKTINITGYYRADDIDEEEVLREKLYALLSDPDGYYITQLKASPESAVERPGETSGGYYDKLSNYPSHKRFLVYTEAPEMELVGNVNGTLLYKLTAEFKTIKLPYGESVPQDFDVKPNVPYYGRNLLTDSGFESGRIPSVTWGPSVTGTIAASSGGATYPIPLGKYMLKIDSNDTSTTLDQFASYPLANTVSIKSGETWTYSYYYASAGSASGQASDYLYNGESPVFELSMGHANRITTGGQTAWHRFTVTFTANSDMTVTHLRFGFVKTNASNHGWICIDNIKLEQNPTATPWSPAPEDPDYNEWYSNTYYNTNNLFIPYAGTVPCNQLEQGFAIEMTAKSASSSLSFKIDDTELTYSGAVASGDVFMFSGFSYTQNGLSIVSNTNKAYFVLQPDKPNRITCNVSGTVRIIGFQNLYA